MVADIAHKRLDIDDMRQWGAYRNPWTGYQIGLSLTPDILLPPKSGVEKSPFEVAAKRLGMPKMSIEHIFYKLFSALLSDAMDNRAAVAKATSE